jgi:transposase
VLAYLVEAYGDLGRIVVPMGPAPRRARSEQVVALVEAGASANEIAARTGLHVRDVHRWRRRLREARSADPA